MKTLISTFLIFLCLHSFSQSDSTKTWETKWLPGNFICTDFEVADSVVWVLGESDHYQSQILKLNLAGNVIDHLETDFVCDKIILDNKQQLWVLKTGYQPAIAKLEQSKFIELTLPQTEFPLQLEFTVFDSKGNVWIPATKNDLWEYNGEKWESISNLLEIENLDTNCELRTSQMKINHSDKIFGSSMNCYGNVQYSWTFDILTQTFEFYDHVFDETMIDNNDRIIFETMGYYSYVYIDGKDTHITFTYGSGSSLMYIDHTNTLWFCMNRNTLTEYYSFKSPSDSLLLDIGYSHMLGWNKHPIPSMLKKGAFKKFQVDRNGVRWAQLDNLGNQSLYRLTDDSTQQIDFIPLTSCYQHNSALTEQGSLINDFLLWRDGLGDIWFQKNNQLYHSSDDCSKPTIPLTQSYLPYEIFTADENGTIWSIDGVDRYDYYSGNKYKDNYYTYIRTYNGVQWLRQAVTGNKFYYEKDKILLDDNQNLWFVYYKRPLSKPGTTPIFLDETSHVGRYYNQQWYFYDTLDSHVQNITLDNQNQVWATSNQGLLKFDGRNWVKYDYETEVPVLQKIVSDVSGNIWGIPAEELPFIYKFDGTNWEIFDTPENISISLIEPDGETGIWISDKLDGVYYSPNGIDWIHYSKQEGLLSRTVSDIVIDGKGNVWVSGFLGISKLNKGTAVTAIETTKEIDNQWNVYPNPASQHITVNGFNENTQVSIYSTKGELLKTSTNKTIAIDDLSEGIYIIKASSDSKNHIFKFIKQP